MNLFDLALAREKRDIALSAVSSYPADDWVSKARTFAIGYAQEYGEVSADEVNKYCPRPDNIHPNATGAVFRTKELRFIGYKPSKKVTSHARRIAIYAPALDKERESISS